MLSPELSLRSIEVGFRQLSPLSKYITRYYFGKLKIHIQRFEIKRFVDKLSLKSTLKSSAQLPLRGA